MKNRYLGYFSDIYPNPGVLRYGEEQASLDQIRRRWEVFLKTSRFAKDICIHVHVPYCKSKCDYCDCSSKALDKSSSMNRFLENLISEMSYLEDTFKDTRFSRLYIGGGTPNILNTKNLKVLLDEVNSRFAFRDGIVKCIELAPELTHKSKLAVMKAAGINRVSIGVQSLYGRTLKAVGRPGIKRKVVKEAVSLLREAGFEELNIDLIYGLAHESNETFHNGLREVLANRPETVTIQLMHDSEVNQVYHSSDHEEENANSYMRYVERSLLSINDEFRDYECHVRPRVCVLARKSMKRPWDEWLDFYSIQDRVIISVLGLGLYAHSKMHGELQYQNNNEDLDFDPGGEVYQTRDLTEELEAFMDAACGLMSQGFFDMGEIAIRYGGLPSRLQGVVDALVSLEQLEKNGDRVTCEAGTDNPLLPAVQAIANKCVKRMV